jgi:hypothetical protein
MKFQVFLNSYNVVQLNTELEAQVLELLVRCRKQTKMPVIIIRTKNDSSSIHMIT